jgi:hypothetical protein
VFLIYVCQKQEQKRLNQLWQIRFSNLTKPDNTVSFKCFDLSSQFRIPRIEAADLSKVIQVEIRKIT